MMERIRLKVEEIMEESSTSQSAVDSIMENYAEDPDRAAEILYHPDPSVRLRAARSSKTPYSLLVELSFDVDQKVRLAVLNNPNTPQPTKQRLCSGAKRR